MSINRPDFDVLSTAEVRVATAWKAYELKRLNSLKLTYQTR